MAQIALNVDPVESDLATVPIDSLRSIGGIRPRILSTLASLRTHLRDTRHGRELWLPLLAAAAIALAAELWLGSVRTQKT